MSTRLGQLLLRENVITPEQLKSAQDQQKEEGGRLTRSLVKLGYVRENELTDFLAKQYGIPSIDLKEFEIDRDVIRLVPKEVAVKHKVIPINRAGSSIIVAVADPSNIFAMDDIKFLTGYDVEMVIGAETDIEDAIERYYESTEEKFDTVMENLDEADLEVDDDGGEEVLDLEKASEEAPVVKLVNLILVDAIKRGASDIHVETYEKDFRVRYRVDGVLYEVMRPPMKMRAAITSRLKIMSNLDIAERRLPQDGRMKLKLGGRKEIDFRVSVLPTLFGEKVVMRLLDRDSLRLDLTELGFDAQPLKVFLDAINRPWGMVLVTGPTGSGKTTTLYSALMDLNKTTVNISTAEDPVEYLLPGINQVQMHDDIGLNFASALRCFLRQDPDIIMVGEIRDFETAEIAIKAALTGHVVLSTLHTNDAPSSISRLLNMGVEPFLVVASVVCVMAQRLSRKVCSNCKEPHDVPLDQLIAAGYPEEEAREVQCYRGRGCPTCHNTGYKGRVALYEVMAFDDELKEFVLNGASAVELKAAAIRGGMQTLRRAALNKLKAGLISLEETLENTAAD